MPIENNFTPDLQLIVPNLHRRYSGVTATNRMVAPKLAKMYRAAWLGPHAPDGIARMGVRDLAKLWRRPAPLNWPLCLMLRIGTARNGARRADRERFHT